MSTAMDRQEEDTQKRIKVLQGENYDSWQFDVRRALKGKGLWHTVKPGKEPADDAPQAEKKAWKTDCAQAHTLISLLCSPSIKADIRTQEATLKPEDEDDEDEDDPEMTPKELWAFLKEEHASASVQAQIRVRQQIQDALRNPQPTMREHIAKLSDLYLRAAECGQTVDEAYRCAELLASLPDQFSGFVATQSTAQKWGPLRLGILHEENRLRDLETRRSRNGTESAFAVGNFNGASGPTPALPTTSPLNGQQWAPPPQQQQQQQQHQSGRGRGGWHGRGRGRGGYSSQGGFPGACHICRRTGHKFTDCANYDAYVKWQESILGERPERVAAVQERQVAPAPDAQDEELIESIRGLEFDICAAIGASTTGSGTFILDTASARHIVTSKKLLNSYAPAPSGTGIECANGSKMAIEGYGTMAVMTDTGATVNMQDVAYCPTAIGNLIGGKRLTKAGCSITFDDTSATVINTHSGKTIMRASVSDGNWTVELRPLGERVAMVKGEAKIDPVAVKAHKTWAHANMDTLRAANAAGLIPGLPKALGDIGFCEACAQGKMARTPHPRIELSERAQRPLSLIHIDIFGPSSMKDELALGGYRFGLIAVDDYTRHTWIIPLRFKSDAIKAIMALHLSLSTQFPAQPISTVRTDGALEFKASDLHNFWVKRGVKHEISPRYSPQSNGVAERNVRSITEKARTMLISARLPSFFWPAAAATAAYVKNRLTAAGLPKDKTPYELLHGKPPDPQPLKPFGCTAWAMLPSTEREGKFDAKSRPYVYLGPAFRGASKLWDPVRQRELIEHSVVFDEDNGAASLLQQQQREEQADVAVLELELMGADRAPRTRPDEVGAERRQDGEDRGEAAIHPRQHVRQALQDALRRHAVPSDVLPAAQAMASGTATSRETMATVARRLAEYSQRGRSASQRPEQDGEQRESAPEREAAGDRGSGKPAEVPTRRSGRLAGEDPPFGMLEGSDGRRRTGTGGEAEETCFAVLEPEAMAHEDPRTVAQALSRPDRQQWLDAMHVEVRSHITRGTWRVVKRYGQANLISAKWVFRLKRNADGSIQKYKARLVARGFTQVEGVDFDETFAPTSRLQNMRLLCALAATLNLDVHQIDFETAYLNARLRNKIVMLPPDGLDLVGYDLLPDDALELMLALYGLKQSGHEWHVVLRDALKTIGFEQCKIDPTMFVRDGNSPAILLVYVDDILVAAPRGGTIEKVKKELLNLFKGTDLGPAHHCLGIRIAQDPKAGTIELDQQRYAEEVLARFGMSDSRPVKTPMCPKANLRKAQDGEARADVKKYQGIVGSLAYLAQGTRPDLAFAVSTLGKFSSDPSETHMVAAKRVLRYIRGTTGARLSFGGDGGTGLVEVEGFVDADWAADKDDRRSMSGFVFKMAGGAVSWGSRKQGAVALSTAEAEYVAAGVAGREALLINGALSAAGKEIGTITVHCDNQAAIQLVRNPGSHHDRSKHIDIVHHWIRDKTQEGAFAFQYIPTDVNPADAFTKALGQVKHQQHARAIGMVLALGTWDPSMREDAIQ